MRCMLYHVVRDLLMGINNIETFWSLDSLAFRQCNQQLKETMYTYIISHLDRHHCAEARIHSLTSPKVRTEEIHILILLPTSVTSEHWNPT